MGSTAGLGDPSGIAGEQEPSPAASRGGHAPRPARPGRQGRHSGGRVALIRIVGGVAVAVAATVTALVLIDLAAPPCPAGRTCIPAAGLSLVLPEGWSRRTADEDGLYAAGEGDDRRLVVEDGRSIIGSATSLDEVERLATEHFGQQALGYAHSGVGAERIDLPVGPAVRVSWISRPWFYQLDQHNVSEWFFLDGRLLVMVYQEVPEGVAARDFSVVRDSLRAMNDE